MIAKVIVDVPANQTDRLFDYAIPKEWEEMIEPGMRVVVPFGPRKIQGFVISVVSESEHAKLKEISEVKDVTPVLTRELLDLGFWLTEKTLCYAVSALQVMLPAAMKANVTKTVVLGNKVNHEAAWVRMIENSGLKWDEFLSHFSHKELNRAIKNDELEVRYDVKEKTAPKTILSISAALTKDELRNEKEKMGNRAMKQQDIISFFLDNDGAISYKELMDVLDTTRSTIKSLVSKAILKEEEVELYRDPYKGRSFKPSEAMELTDLQKNAISPILESLENRQHGTFLIHGVTGSGKTEIYLQSIHRVLEQGKEAIVLVPEISLTPQMVTRFKSRFGSEVAVLHSGLSRGEKYDEWRKIHRKEVKVVVGARSAVFAPFTNLGIIIIDEEHESSYKQEENPRYHARDVAIKRGEHYQCPVVLGSATPSLESYARASKGVYTLIELLERVNKQAMPEVSIVDMREELRSGNRSMFSNELYDKLKVRLEKKEQTVLFLNRRGYSTFVMCRDCGFVVECPHCDISLTYHKMNGTMRCHYCGHEERFPSQCPECESEHIRFFGTGTQRVEEELTKILPEARVVRMDVDTTRRKGSHEKLLNQFGEGKADILLGTQMIAKGLDFPNVTLVGVLAGDAMLHLPDFRASEKTFQLLTQVSGRAGRHILPGEVIVQSYTPEHYSIEMAADHDFQSFYKREMVTRKQFGYPPFYFLAMVNVSHEELTKTVDVTEKITSFLKSKLSNASVVLGPVASPIPRIKDRYRYQCMIKYKTEPNLNDHLKEIQKHYSKDISRGGLQLTIDTQPYMMM
ncbi:primosomal protein N' [Guptibacillus hwajinpoensis]|uniref:Replication restart protein PriA n=1 Tax=Guptibacillus hwajinpoensis TaxID=208199 RepID=A0A0J6D379_9BACL|nr:primosomal protein N' [Alkalihalobacillus macyae]KMM38729.1 primosomal protein N' [Alkalihalobacillus macyae]